MMRILACLTLLVSGPLPAAAQHVQMADLGPGTARVVRGVAKAAHDAFARLPAVSLTSRIAVICDDGAGGSMQVRYCMTRHKVFVAADLSGDLPAPAIAYLTAHALGHAIQVRHGLIDEAHAVIRAQPARAVELRTMIEAQADCLAGVLLARAGEPAGVPSDWFAAEPLTGAHWGDAPISNAASVSMGLDARDRWVETGRRAGEVKACAVGDLSAARLIAAER